MKAFKFSKNFKIGLIMDKNDILDLYDSLVMDHSKRPRNFGTLETKNISQGFNPSCGDKIILYAIIKDGIIENVKFNGEGCALCISSCSLMIQQIIGMSLDEAKKYLQDFSNFIIKSEDLSDEYAPLHIFSNVHKYPARVKCVLLSWRAMENLLKNNTSTVNTEE